MAVGLVTTVVVVPASSFLEGGTTGRRLIAIGEGVTAAAYLGGEIRELRGAAAIGEETPEPITEGGESC